MALVKAKNKFNGKSFLLKIYQKSLKKSDCNSYKGILARFFKKFYKIPCKIQLKLKAYWRLGWVGKWHFTKPQTDSIENPFKSCKNNLIEIHIKAYQGVGLTNDICHIHKFPKILKNPIGTHIKAYGGWVELTNGTYQSRKQI